MKNMEGKDFYSSLLKKELQDLCRKHGLSPYMTKPNLVSSLCAYIKKKNNLPCPREVRVSKTSQVQDGVLDHRANLAERASTSAKSSKSVPSFQLYVSSEEGINLFVDLNSSMLDWSERLESNVCSCKNIDEKCGSLREELELLGDSNKRKDNLFLWNTDSKLKRKGDHLKTESSSFLVKRKCETVVLDHPFEGDASVTKPCSLTPSHHVTQGAQSSLLYKETIPLDSSSISSPQTKSSCDCIVNCTPEDPKRLKFLEHQNSEISGKNLENLALPDICTHVNASLVYPGSSSSASMEIQFSEVLNQQKDVSFSPCRNNGILGVVDPMLNVETGDNELANSGISPDQMSTCTEEQVKSKLVCGTKTSESLQLNKSLENKLKESDKVVKSLMQHSRTENLNCCGELNVRILRSRKNNLDGVLPRRSKRLVSKDKVAMSNFQYLA